MSNQIQPIKTQPIIPVNNAVCKYCGSTHTKKYGFYKGVQRYYCHDCKRKFSVNDQLFKMKTPANQVSSALDEYYKGMSVNDIRDYLNEQYHNLPSSHTIYEWIEKYTHEAENQFKNYHPEVGSEWIADETVLRIAGENYWLIDIIDKDTRYLLATKLSPNRETKDIKTLMERAKERAGKVPKKVLTDGWKGYIDGIELAYGADAKHIVTDPFDKDKTGENSELIERWHGTLKDRSKVMRGLKSVENAREFLDGFLIYYNYFRPHESLNGKTPAEQAKLVYACKSWADITRMAKPRIEILTTPAKVDILSEHEPTFRPTTHRNYNLKRKDELRNIHRENKKPCPNSGIFRDNCGTRSHIKTHVPRMSSLMPHPKPRTPNLTKRVKQHYSRRGGGLTRRGDI